MILRQREINFTPGEEWSYSNSNYVLLPEIVARVSGMPFSQFARKRIFEPLGMRSTSHPEDPLFLIKNRALAYKKEKDAWKMDMYLGKERGGAGALFTTAADLAAWNDALAKKRLGATVSQKLIEPATLNNGRKLSYARGLQLEPFRRGGQMVWHSGGAAGYSAVTGHLPQHGLSFAITCNSDGSARSQYAGRLLDLFLPDAGITDGTNVVGGGKPTGGANTPPFDPGDGLRSRAGIFFDQKTGLPLRLVVNNNTLAIPGGGPLIPSAADRFRNQRTTPFFMSEAEFELQFLTADQIELRTKDGIVTRYRRAQAWTPAADDLEVLAGHYRSDELMGYFDATPTKDGLAVRANDGNTVEFKPVERDTFQFGGSLIRFTRDKAGKVVGLEYTNPLLRKVKFTRQSDR